MEDHPCGVVTNEVQEGPIETEPRVIRKPGLSRPQIQRQVRVNIVVQIIRDGVDLRVLSTDPLRGRGISLDVVSRPGSVLAASAESVNLHHIGQVEIVGVAVEPSEVRLFRVEDVLEAHPLEGGRDIEDGSVRESGELDLEAGPQEETPEEARPAAPPVRGLDEALLQAGQPVAGGHLSLLTGEHEDGADDGVGSDGDGRGVQTGLVAGQKSAPPHRRRHRDQPPLPRRGSHHEVHLPVSAVRRCEIAVRLQKKKKIPNEGLG